MTNVLFVCIQNAGRSQMAEELFRLRAGAGHEARSCGSRPAPRVHPEVVEALREVGVDVESKRPQGLDPELVAWADLVVTMGCGDACPVLPGKRHLDWELPDPHGRRLDAVREIRDEIAGRVDALLTGGC